MDEHFANAASLNTVTIQDAGEPFLGHGLCHAIGRYHHEEQRQSIWL